MILLISILLSIDSVTKSPGGKPTPIKITTSVDPATIPPADPGGTNDDSFTSDGPADLSWGSLVGTGSGTSKLTPDSPVARGRGGPRIKHVCRKSSIALGKALFPESPSSLRLSALPLTDKQKLLEVDGRGSEGWYKIVIPFKF